MRRLGYALLPVGMGGVVLAASSPEPVPSADEALFRTAEVCMACHNGVVTPTGEDVSIGSNWRASMMANAARDPYWQAGVRREILDHPESRAEIEDECATCHMPMARYTSNLAGGLEGVFANLPVGGSDAPLAALAADGVSCAVCHQIQPDNLGTEESFTGGFRVSTSGPASGTRPVYGPFEVDSGRVRVMRSASGFEPTEAAHIQRSALCGSCHTVYAHARDGEGNEVGELPEQMPYLEWLHSDYRDEQSCQSCHMPVIPGEVPVTGVLSQPRPEVSRHVFRGGNFFMLRMLNRYRSELGVAALPAELENAAARTEEHLATNAATLELVDLALAEGRLTFAVEVTNLGGHKLPTAYPSRRVWLQVTVTDPNGRAVFASGAPRADGSIEGNDNDADPARYEPHWEVIERPDQVQVFEAVLEDYRGGTTTGLLNATGYLKDNRILPRGFDKETAERDVEVVGAARGDPDFVGGSDRVRYRIQVGEGTGPLTVSVALWYQPIAFRWARNLEAYDALETRRFSRYYREMSEGSGAVLARAEATAGG